MLYPSIERIIEYNILVLDQIKMKKTDKPELLSKSKLREAINNCEEFQGDIYSKAAILLREIIQAHAFASGNQRTAFLATKKISR